MEPPKGILPVSGPILSTLRTVMGATHSSDDEEQGTLALTVLPIRLILVLATARAG